MLKIFKNHLLLLLISTIFCSYVYWEPEIPVPGETITIYYNTIDGSLPGNTFPVYVHLGYNGWNETEDYAMSYYPLNGMGWWKYEYLIPEDAETIDFVFTDLNDNWDNNGGIGIDWHISLNYYWAPFNPSPNDNIEVVLNNLNQGGYILWTIDAGNGYVAPIEEYWPEGSYLQNQILYTPLSSISDNSYNAILGPFNLGNQIVEAVKFNILWDDGTYDIGDNGQIIYYDVYLDFETDINAPNIVFTSPQMNDQIMGDVQISCTANADFVEFWMDGSLIGIDYNEPFDLLWTPEEGTFGDISLAAKAIGNNGNISFSFVDFYLQYEINNSPIQANIDDGLNIDGNNVVITLYAPEKEFVAIKGSWNSQFPNGEIMNLSGDTLWWYATVLDDGIYEYQYNLEGEKYIADPWSENVEWKDPFTGNESANFQHAKTIFEIGAVDFEWSSNSYNRPSVEDLVIYELHVGDFIGVEGTVGTYSEIINKINEGYFHDLGINAIELMPINEFEGEYSWGYNPSFSFAPESSYGTPNELKNFIDIAHQNGIAIIVDVIFNHLWGSSPLFQLYHPLDNYDWEDHDFENCPYFDNAESQWGYKLQHWHNVNGRDYRGWKYVLDALMHWVQEYRIDGYRFDYVDGIGWGNQNDGAAYYVNELNNYDSSLILIAEADNSYQINNTFFDSGWDYSYHHNLFDNILDIYTNLNNITSHINAYDQGYSFVTGPVNYIESHDENRLIYQSTQFQGHSFLDACKRSKIGATILFTSHGVPMLYQGQEFAQNAPTRDSFGYPIAQPLQWNNLNDSLSLDLNNHYKKVINLRNDYSVLKEPPLNIRYIDNSNKILSYWRENQNEKVVVVINLDTQPHSINLEFPNNGLWEEKLQDFSIDIESSWYGDFVLNSLTSYVFATPLSQCLPGDVNVDGIINVIDIVSVVNYIIIGGNLSESESCTMDLNSDGIINVIDIVSLVSIITS